VDKAFAAPLWMAPVDNIVPKENGAAPKFPVILIEKAVPEGTT